MFLKLYAIKEIDRIPATDGLIEFHFGCSSIKTLTHSLLPPRPEFDLRVVMLQHSWALG
jgi:hypothetical protein